MKLKDKETILMSYLLGELSQEKRMEVEKWIDASSENEKEYKDFTRIWELSLFQPSPEFNADKAWENVETKLNKPKSSFRPWMAIAASIALLLASYYIITDKKIYVHEIATSSQTNSDTLKDGSILILNEFSSITYTDDFNKTKREINLKGEAFFEITSNPNKEFVIHLNQSSVTVLGTSFNIKSYDKEETISVYVKTGIVRYEYISDDSSQSTLSIDLKAGEKVIYNKRDCTLIKINEEDVMQANNYWVDKKLNFESIRMENVFKVLEAVYNVNITYDNKRIGNCLLTAQFDNTNISSILEVLATTFDLEIEKSNNSYIIKGIGCE